MTNNNIVSKVRKTQATCHDCNEPFILEDAKDWRHYEKCGIGSAECPNCYSCIRHGETAEEIEARFQDNLKKGKFKPSTKPYWRFECVGNIDVDVPVQNKENSS